MLLLLYHLPGLYVYVVIIMTFFLDLPFVKTPFIFLVIGGIICSILVVLLCFECNITKSLLNAYFS